MKVGWVAGLIADRRCLIPADGIIDLFPVIPAKAAVRCTQGLETYDDSGDDDDVDRAFRHVVSVPADGFPLSRE
jgi:hypothetical protein